MAACGCTGVNAAAANTPSAAGSDAAASLPLIQNTFAVDAIDSSSSISSIDAAPDQSTSESSRDLAGERAAAAAALSFLL